MPVTVSVALSVTLRVPDCGIWAEPLIDGVVVVLAVHSPSLPRAKSNSVAVRDWEERVSPMNTLKHLPPRFVRVRLRPPSKNSASWRVFPTPSVLFEVFHGVVIGPVIGAPVFVVAQTSSPPAVPLQSAPWATDVAPSDPPAPPFQR